MIDSAGANEVGDAFFTSTLPSIIRWVARIPELFIGSDTQPVSSEPIKGPPVLVAGRPGHISLTCSQATSLLAHMFLCLPIRYVGPGAENLDMPYAINFSPLFAKESPWEMAKLKCFVHFFERMAVYERGGDQTSPTGYIHYRRVSLPSSGLDASDWVACSAPLTPLTVKSSGGIDDAVGWLQADFANKCIGGGVLVGGCVQEEIRFAVSPVATVSLCLCETMGDCEAVRIAGLEYFSYCKGYGPTLQYGGDVIDKTERWPSGTFRNVLTAMDALVLRGWNLTDQLEDPVMTREAGKAYTAFGEHVQENVIDWGGSLSGINVLEQGVWREEERPREEGVSTGNWGCGAFAGNVEVKSMVQWMAAARCGKKVRYYTFDRNAEFQKRLEGISVLCMQKGVTVGGLWGAIVEFRETKLKTGRENLGDESLLRYLIGKFGE
eukprot:comp17707_c1_seq1/m.17599 comp17707_c1_seq1/g.17599  ORF comp17707_c1_seq1/g.17599 comp17707_c1_seq1/m.17599 type:complete len:437 (-) comp17707_c1_seq1:135-1445(-)